MLRARLHQTEIDQIIDTDQVIQIRELITDHAYLDDKIHEYVVRLGRSTRNSNVSDFILYGISPRAYQHMLALSRTAAFCDGRSHVTPDDVKSIAIDAMRHRVVLYAPRRGREYFYRGNSGTADPASRSHSVGPVNHWILNMLTRACCWSILVLMSGSPAVMQPAGEQKQVHVSSKPATAETGINVRHPCIWPRLPPSSSRRSACRCPTRRRVSPSPRWKRGFFSKPAISTWKRPLLRTRATPASRP